MASPILIPSRSDIVDLPIPIELWPNPFTSKINLNLRKPNTELAISVFNANGQILFSKKALSNGNGLVEIELPKDWPKGIYIISLSTAETSYNVMGIKQ